MPSTYTITEPHPTVLKDTYTHSGRGGAGNTFRVSSATSPPAGVPTRVVSHTPSARSHTSHASASAAGGGRFYSGRGGAGNAHAADERPTLSFDEEYARGVREMVSAAGFVGRGGAGNAYREQGGASLAAPEGSDLGRTESASSSGSGRSGFWHRLSMGHR